MNIYFKTQNSNLHNSHSTWIKLTSHNKRQNLTELTLKCTKAGKQ